MQLDGLAVLFRVPHGLYSGTLSSGTFTVWVAPWFRRRLGKNSMCPLCVNVYLSMVRVPDEAYMTLLPCL